MVTSTVCINLAQQPTIWKFLHFFQVFSDRELEIFNKVLQLRLKTPTPKTDHFQCLELRKSNKNQPIRGFFFLYGALLM